MPIVRDGATVIESAPLVALGEGCGVDYANGEGLLPCYWEFYERGHPCVVTSKVPIFQYCVLAADVKL